MKTTTLGGAMVGVLAAFAAVGAARTGVGVPAARADDPIGISASYDDVKGLLRELIQKFPSSARIVEIGLNDAGQMIEGLRVGDGPVHNLVVATHHGNEFGSAEVAKAFAAHLAENPIVGQTVTVIPVLNIGGYNTRTRWERLGGRNVDPNRDYPGPCGTAGPYLLKSTKALADYVETQGIVSSATLHTFSPAVVYPWGFAAADLNTRYTDIFKLLTQAAVVESGYPAGNSTELIYPAAGTYEDYVFWKHGTWSLLFELGYSHSPAPGAVQEMIRVNVPGLRRFLEQAPPARAEHHAFESQCDKALTQLLDRHDE